MLVSMNQAGTSLGGRPCDKGIDKRKPLGGLAPKVERGEGHLLVNHYDVIQKILIALHDLVSLGRGGSQLSEPASKFGERHAGRDDLGVNVLEQGLNTLPTRFLAVVGDHRRSV